MNGENYGRTKDYEHEKNEGRGFKSQTNSQLVKFCMTLSNYLLSV